MSSLPTPFAPPYVTVVLDTEAPKLHYVGPKVVVPPDLLRAEVSSSEELAETYVEFVDPSGINFVLGAMNPIEILVPTVGMAGGRGLLQVSGWDLAGNLTTLEVPVEIDARDLYDIEVSMDATDAPGVGGALYDLEVEMNVHG